MRRCWLVFSAVAMVLGSGCQATGMGWIQSADLVDKATFGFVFANPTNDFAGSLSGSYHDPNGRIAELPVDVAFKGTGVLKKCAAGDPLCANAPVGAKGGCAGGIPAYTSQNPKLPGDGTFLLMMCDLDGTLDAGPDFMQLIVLSGPYMGYRNEGFPHGNITVSP